MHWIIERTVHAVRGEMKRKRRGNDFVGYGATILGLVGSVVGKFITRGTTKVITHAIRSVARGISSAVGSCITVALSALCCPLGITAASGVAIIGIYFLVRKLRRPQEEHLSLPPPPNSTQDQHTQTVAGDDGAGNTAAPNQPPEAYRMPPAAERGGASRWDREPTEGTDMDDPQRPILCSVCTMEPPGMMFAECGHCCCCEACVWEMATRRGINDGDVVVLECPQCRTEGTMQRVYLP